MPFAPTDIAGLVVWAKGDVAVYKDAGVTLATVDGDQVQQWNDQSGAANHAIQLTGANRPLFETSQVNGLAIVRFTAASSFFMNLAGLAMPSSFTLAYVAKRNDNASNQGLLGGHTTGGGLNNFYLQRGSDSSKQQGCWDSTNGWVQGGVDSVLPAGVYEVGGARRNNTAKTVDFIRRDIVRTAGYGSNPTTTTDIWLGKGDSAAEYLNADVAEICLYNTAIADADLTNLLNYLGTTRYALSTAGKRTVTQVGLDVVDTRTPAARVTQVGQDVMNTGYPRALLTQLGLDVTRTANPVARMSQLGVDVVWGRNVGRVTQLLVEAVIQQRSGVRRARPGLSE